MKFDISLGQIIIITDQSSQGSPGVIAGDSRIFGWRFGSNTGDLPIHSCSEENTYFSLLGLINGVVKISKHLNKR